MPFSLEPSYGFDVQWQKKVFLSKNRTIKKILKRAKSWSWEKTKYNKYYTIFISFTTCCSEVASEKRTRVIPVWMPSHTYWRTSNTSTHMMSTRTLWQSYKRFTTIHYDASIILSLGFSNQHWLTTDWFVSIAF